MAFEYHQFPYGGDNYAVLVHDPETGQTACIDAGDGDAVMNALEVKGWTLTQLWITHHHGDHVAGVPAVKEATGATAFGPFGISGVDQILVGGDTFEFAGQTVEVLHTPGHTLDMLNFYLPGEGVVFTGDTLFVMGCGRMFEGNPAMMWDSLQKLAGLPPETVIYCAHEYTMANAAFTKSVDPDNPALPSRIAEVEQLRAQGLPTVPTTLAQELQTNPFLRAESAERFAELRRRKDNF